MRYDPIETISAKNTTPLTQIQRIIAHMFEHPERREWFAGDFMQPRLPNDHPHFVGYEATARMSDAISKYNEEGKPELFAVKREGKFRIVQIRWDHFRAVLKAYPDLIPLAERTGILNRFEGLRTELEAYKPKEKVKKAVFKSY